MLSESEKAGKHLATRSSALQLVLGGLLLALLAAGAYWKVTRNGFINFDDPDYVTDNLIVRAGLHISGIVWSFASSHASNWHPVTWLSHMLDCQLFGINPAGHHLSSLLIHIINAFLLFLFLRLTTGQVWRGLA